MKAIAAKYLALVCVVLWMVLIVLGYNASITWGVVATAIPILGLIALSK